MNRWICPFLLLCFLYQTPVFAQDAASVRPVLPETQRHFLIKGYPLRWLWEALVHRNDLSRMELSGISAEVAPLRWISLEVEPVLGYWKMDHYKSGAFGSGHEVTLFPQSERRKLSVRWSVHFYPDQLLNKKIRYTPFQRFHIGLTFMHNSRKFDSMVIQAYEEDFLYTPYTVHFQNGVNRMTMVAVSFGYNGWLDKKHRLHWGAWLMSGAAVYYYTYSSKDENYYSRQILNRNYLYPQFRIGGTLGYAF